MDLPMEDVAWTNRDLNNFEFQASPTVALRKLDSDVASATTYHLFHIANKINARTW